MFRLEQLLGSEARVSAILVAMSSTEGPLIMIPLHFCDGF